MDKDARIRELEAALAEAQREVRRWKERAEELAEELVYDDAGGFDPPPTKQEIEEIIAARSRECRICLGTGVEHDGGPCRRCSRAAEPEVERE